MFMQTRFTGNSTLLYALDTYAPAAKITNLASPHAIRTLTVCRKVRTSKLWLHQTQDLRSRSQYCQPDDTDTFAARSKRRWAIALATKSMQQKLCGWKTRVCHNKYSERTKTNEKSDCIHLKVQKEALPPKQREVRINGSTSQTYIHTCP